jgi:hypothetical protein
MEKQCGRHTSLSSSTDIYFANDREPSNVPRGISLPPVNVINISHNVLTAVRFCPSKKPKYSYSYIQARGFMSGWQHRLIV